MTTRAKPTPHERLLEAASSTGHGSVRPIPLSAEVMRQLAARSSDLTQQETLP
ncbi:hypothetical protein OG607_19485 [Streptomyces sp. NBC_01537]|uniref:hypothetical protein n=1 Tax=Streptomyces sp. NBC_01537 TaxID=2903896 RepID=UPI0038679B3A